MTDAARRILVAGVGYDNLRDLSVGRLLVDRLRNRPWPTGVAVEDLSYGAVSVLHWLQEREPFDAAVFVAGIHRGRPPGSVHRYRWSGDQLSGDQVQGHVEEGVTGVINLDATLAVGAFFGALPPRVVVVEVEPAEDDWGLELSPVVQAVVPDVERHVSLAVEELAE